MSRRRTQKRVRFSDVDELEAALHPNLDAGAQRITVLPEPEEELWHPSKIEREEGPIKSTNPKYAAAVRARRRHEQQLSNLQDGEDVEEVETCMLDDRGLEGVDVELEQRFTEDGIPIEPFDLRAEMAAGYFDAEGNYVAYPDEDDTDAWLATLPAGPLELDGREAVGEEGEEEDNVEKRPMMTEAEKANYRQSIVEKLQSGESVLGALKRLGSPEVAGGSPQGGGSKAKKVAVRTRLAGTVPTENRELFNEITDHAGQLLNAGDTSIYSRTREDLAADLRRGEAVPASSAGSTPAHFGGSRSGVNQEAIELLAKLARDGADAMEDEDEDMGVGGGTAAVAVADPEADLFAEVEVSGGNESGSGTGATEGVLEGSGMDSAHADGGGLKEDGSGPTTEMAGFEFDETSGLYYNTTLGCYFDAKKQLYGDASSGKWYSYENGAYKLAALPVGST